MENSRKDYRVYTLLGDGGIQKGRDWETFVFANQYRLDNLWVIIDNNGLQAGGNVRDVMNTYPIVEKLRAFGLRTEEIDGHDFK